MERRNEKLHCKIASKKNGSNTQRKEEKYIRKNYCYCPLLCIGRKVSLVDREQNSLLPAISFANTGGYTITLPMSKLYNLDAWGPYLQGYPCDDRPRPENKEKITLIWFDPNMSQDQKYLLDRLRAINDFSLIYIHLDACVNCLQSIHTEKIICVTTSLGSTQLVPSLSNLAQLDSIFIYGDVNASIPSWLVDQPKFAGTFSTWETFEASLKNTIKCLLRHIEISAFFDQHQSSIHNVTKMKADFFW